MATPDMKKRAADIGLLPLDSPSIDGITRLHQVRAGEVGLAGARSSAAVAVSGAIASPPLAYTTGERPPSTLIAVPVM